VLSSEAIISILSRPLLIVGARRAVPALSGATARVDILKSIPYNLDLRRANSQIPPLSLYILNTTRR
jgi:hypothetical protein